MSTGNPGANGDLHGHGGHFQEACDDAYGKRGHGAPTDYVVTEISVTGNNPITGYSVVLRPKA